MVCSRGTESVIIKFSPDIIFTFVSTILARYFELATELALLEGRDFLESPEAALLVGVKGRGDPKTLVFVDVRLILVAILINWIFICGAGKNEMEVLTGKSPIGLSLNNAEQRMHFDTSKFKEHTNENILHWIKVFFNKVFESTSCSQIRQLRSRE